MVIAGKNIIEILHRTKNNVNLSAKHFRELLQSA